MSFATTTAAMSKAVALIDKLEVDAKTASTGWLALLESAEAALSGSVARKAAGHMRRQRNALAQLVTVAAAKGYYEPLLSQAAIDIAYQAHPDTPLWGALYDYMRTNSEDVLERDLTFGSSSFSGTGTGTLYRLTVDEQGHEMQGWFADDYVLKCVADGRRTLFAGNEIFSLAGTPRTEDGLDLDGGGVGPIQGTIRPLRPEGDTRNLVANAMFTQSTDTAAVVSDLPNWAITGAGTLELDTTNLYWDSSAPLEGVSTYNSLKFQLNKKIAQRLVVDTRKNFDLNAPYFNAVLLRKNGACDGSVVLDFGAQTRTVAMSGLTNDEWVILLVPSAIGANSWFLNMNQNDMTVSIEQTGNTTGSFSVAGVFCAKMTRMGYLANQNRWGGRGCMGHYFALPAAKDGGSGFTPFVSGDNWSWADSEGATRGKLQYWAARAALGYFRHDPTPTIAQV